MVRRAVRRSWSVASWCGTAPPLAYPTISVWLRVVRKRTPVCSPPWRRYAHGATLVRPRINADQRGCRADGGTLMVRLLLVRHAATAWTAQGRFQGQADVPLS